MPGHWEGDLIVGAMGRSAVATLVERTTRLGMLIKVENKTTEHVAAALSDNVVRLPDHLARSITWDQGTEMAATPPLRLRLASLSTSVIPTHRGNGARTRTGMALFVSSSKGHRPVRLFPTRTRRHRRDTQRRPRKTLEWDTPAERFNELVAITT